MSVLRGQIQIRELHQENDFSGLLFKRNITPTDIDCFVDLGDKLFVFIETKWVGSPMKWGQATALERLVNATHKSAEDEIRYSLAIKAFHTNSPPEDIDTANALVQTYYLGGERMWRQERNDRTVRQFLDDFIHENNIRY